MPCTVVDTTSQSITAEIIGSVGASSDRFSGGLAVNGDYMIVGAHQSDLLRDNAGAAYIFERDPVTGAWGEVLVVLPTGTAALSMYFGMAVAAAGDRLFVGCRGDDQRKVGPTPAGAIYTYVRVGGVWTQETKLYADAGYYYCGNSVCVSSDGLMVVGVANVITSINVAWYWHYSGGTWNGPFALPRVDGFGNDGFGPSIAISPDKTTIAVGCYVDNDVGLNTGSVYIWTGTPAGGYTLQQKIYSNSPFVSQEFGLNVGLHDDTIAVTARYKDFIGSGQGLIQIYTRSGGVWSFVRELASASIFLAENTGWNEGGSPYTGEYRLQFPDANTLIAPSPGDSSYMNSGNQGAVWWFKANPDWATGYTAGAIWPDMTQSTTASRFGACVSVQDGGRLYVSRPIARLTGSSIGSVVEITYPDDMFPWSTASARYTKRARDSAAPSPPPADAYVTWETTDLAGAYGGVLPYGGPLVDEAILHTVR